MNRTVILQPQFFPWRGVFEQIRLANCYIHLDDAVLPQGRSFVSRVQIKTAHGPQWLTVPVMRGHAAIRNVRTDESQGWRQTHIKTLQTNYARAPFCDEMLQIVSDIYAHASDSLCEINITGIETISRYLGLSCSFFRASDFPSINRSTERLVELSREVGASHYLTGHGALNYLTPEPFEAEGVEVEIIDYQRTPYPQLFQGFDPHVSILDLIANTGQKAATYLESNSQEWREYERAREIST
jgi:hypothetical protein